MKKLNLLNLLGVRNQGSFLFYFLFICISSYKRSNKYVQLYYRFGFALTNLGDLNKDGYEDIAIGAPYEKKGTVYIYLGSKNGIITIPSQVPSRYISINK